MKNTLAALALVLACALPAQADEDFARLYPATVEGISAGVDRLAALDREVDRANATVREAVKSWTDQNPMPVCRGGSSCECLRPWQNEQDAAQHRANEDAGLPEIYKRRGAVLDYMRALVYLCSPGGRFTEDEQRKLVAKLAPSTGGPSADLAFTLLNHFTVAEAQDAIFRLAKERRTARGGNLRYALEHSRHPEAIGTLLTLSLAGRSELNLALTGVSLSTTGYPDQRDFLNQYFERLAQMRKTAGSVDARYAELVFRLALQSNAATQERFLREYDADFALLIRDAYTVVRAGTVGIEPNGIDAAQLDALVSKSAKGRELADSISRVRTDAYHLGRDTMAAASEVTSRIATIRTRLSDIENRLAERKDAAQGLEMRNLTNEHASLTAELERIKAALDSLKQR